MSIRFERLEIPDLILVQLDHRVDDRGFFRETYKQSAFLAGGIALPFVQDNHSHSARGVLRGLHFQKDPQAQGKLVMVTRGEIFDAAVDLRRGSPTYARWAGLRLTAPDGCLLYVPPGFAHGFCALVDDVDVIYKVTAEYSPELDRGIIWNDPDIGIEWPIRDPSLSPKDAKLPRLKDCDNEFQYR